MANTKWRCDRCGHHATSKQNLISHLKNKNPCDTTSSLEGRQEYIKRLTHKPLKSTSIICDKCKKVVHKAGYARHTRTCKGDKKRDHIVRTKIYDNQALSTEDAIIDDQDVSDICSSIEEDISKYKEAECTISHQTRTEQFYQRVLERHFNASHHVLVCGITDITTSDCHIEIKRWSGWQQAIGQLQIYNNDLKRDKLMACFFGDISSKIKNIAATNMNKLGIQCLEFFNHKGRFCLRDVITNQVIKLNYLD
jgi:hypothetical protein